MKGLGECWCTGVAIGSHAVGVELPIPDHMADYRSARVRAGLSPAVSVDACLVPEIVALWRAGIGTTGCCCGHNQGLPGFIGVFPEHVEVMKALGYRVQPNESRPGAEDSFWPKSFGQEPPA